MFGFKNKKFELKSPVTGKIVNLIDHSVLLSNYQSTCLEEVLIK